VENLDRSDKLKLIEIAVC